MSQLTTAEHVFEKYLSQHGLDFERIATHNAPTPDYRLKMSPAPVIAEVKQFSHSQKIRVGGYCPVPFVVRKIWDSWRQFELYQNEACCLVLYNESSSTVFLQPELILSAMFGEYMNRRAQGIYRFSGIAAMQPHRNTRISAVVALLPLRVQRNCVEAGRLMAARANGSTRDLTDEEILRETLPYAGQVEGIMRAVAIDNPFAQHPMEPSIFTGPYDERWAQVEGGNVRLTFSGTKVAELRSILPEYALKMMGL